MRVLAYLYRENRAFTRRANHLGPDGKTGRAEVAGNDIVHAVHVPRLPRLQLRIPAAALGPNGQCTRCLPTAHPLIFWMRLTTALCCTDGRSNRIAAAGACTVLWLSMQVHFNICGILRAHALGPGWITFIADLDPCCRSLAISFPALRLRAAIAVSGCGRLVMPVCGLATAWFVAHPLVSCRCWWHCGASIACFGFLQRGQDKLRLRPGYRRAALCGNLLHARERQPPSLAVAQRRLGARAGETPHLHATPHAHSPSCKSWYYSPSSNMHACRSLHRPALSCPSMTQYANYVRPNNGPGQASNDRGCLLILLSIAFLIKMGPMEGHSSCTIQQGLLCLCMILLHLSAW